MARLNPKVKTKKPKTVLERPLTVNLKTLFKAVAKGLTHSATGEWGEVAADAVDALFGLGLTTEPGELGFLLIRRSLARAVFELVGESGSRTLVDEGERADLLVDDIELAMEFGAVHLDHKFFERPSDFPLLVDLQSELHKWLLRVGIDEAVAVALVARLPSYFVYALTHEWRQNAKDYRPLVEAMATPFTSAGDREWAWTEYSALLQRKIHESVFDEPFSLHQIYVPLNAALVIEDAGAVDTNKAGLNAPPRLREVVSAEAELSDWLRGRSAQDVIRVISGGPGSGKSSFARVFAARVSQQGLQRVLFVPLHLIDPSKDLVEEVGRFVQDEGVLLSNPLDATSPEPNLLIILDGLDELASQGKAAAETARGFVREVERTVERRNQQSVRLRVLLSGRELVVQENDSEFRRPRQVLTLLPYFLPQAVTQHATQPGSKPIDIRDGERYYDPQKLLSVDLRQTWWKNYGRISGKRYQGLPQELGRSDLAEITAQPLLNYLVALSFVRDTLDFTGDINLNSIYADLVKAVHERGYEKRRPYGPIRHLKASEFLRVLEETGLAAWHGDGRSTTVREVEAHCRTSGLGALLDVFQEGARAGVTRLLAAFFFRQFGQRPAGDPTFVFTHKSFGEYLAARRIVRAVERIARELAARAKDPDGGWDERDALRHWAQVCGPSPVTHYLHGFILNEIRLKPSEEVGNWQEAFSKLFAFVLRHGLPMEQLQLANFKEARYQARNAEESLLVALNACARVTKQLSRIDAPDESSFGAWFKRIQEQRVGPESLPAARCLSFLDLTAANLFIGDFYRADLSFSCLRRAGLNFACFHAADLTETDLSSAFLSDADFALAQLRGANLSGARIDGANFAQANLSGANFSRAVIMRRGLSRETSFAFAMVEGANLEFEFRDRLSLRALGLSSSVSGRRPAKSVPHREKG